MKYKMSDFKNNSLYDRVNKLLVSYEWSDCSFSVHGENFKAHKLILGISSPVFEAMFYGPLSSNDPIVITDIDPHIFQLLLKYIYTDIVEIHSIEEAYDLLYVSRKYLMEYLTEICITYIELNMSIDNVISILNYPSHMQDNRLVAKALKLFCRHADYMLKENKSSINSKCMRKILKSNEMNILEKDLIKNVFEWTSYVCEQNEIDNSFENRREILINSGLFKLLRFYILSMNDLEDITNSKNNLLLSHEEENIKQIVKNTENINNLCINNSVNGKMSPRKPVKYHWCLCHRLPLRSESPIIIDQTNSTIQTLIKGNKSTFVHSVSVQSRMAPVIVYCSNIANVYHEKFSVLVTCEEDNSIIKKYDFQRSVDYDSHINIEFEEPLLFIKDMWYKISFIWPQSNTFHHYSYGVEIRDPCYNNGKIKFEFEDISGISDNNGSFLRGLKFCM